MSDSPLLKGYFTKYIPDTPAGDSDERPDDEGYQYPDSIVVMPEGEEPYPDSYFDEFNPETEGEDDFVPYEFTEEEIVEILSDTSEDEESAERGEDDALLEDEILEEARDAGGISEDAEQEREAQARSLEVLITDAQDEADRIIDSARAEAENIKAAAYSEGYAQGVSDAAGEVERILTAAENDAERIVGAANSALENKTRECERDIIGFALEIAKKVVKTELRSNNTAFMNMLSSALDQVKDEKQITLKVSYDEYENFFSSRDFAKITTPTAHVAVDIMSDPTVEPFGALIETQAGVIDISPSAQLRQIENALE